jgi:hypothetical protein
MRLCALVRVKAMAKVQGSRAYILRDGTLLEARLHAEGEPHDAPEMPGDVIRVCVSVTVLQAEEKPTPRSFEDQPLPFGDPQAPM